MKTDKQIIKQAEDYVTELYAGTPHENLLYHSIDHTREVVENVNQISAHYDLQDNDIALLNIAAWFHDTGHLFTDPSGHEIKSVELMRAWLVQHPEHEGMGDELEKLILATKMSNPPDGLKQEIIKDADTYHFGTKNFRKYDKLVKKEMELRNQGTLTMDWRRNTLALLQSHQYYTSHCKDLLESGKLKNMARIKKKIELNKDHDNASSNIIPTANEDGKSETPKQSAIITKGIQTMLRLTSENHMRLSEMADNKANILISVNAIIISVILTVLIRKIEVDRHLAIPTMIFLATSLTTIVLSILATRPKITNGKFSREDILNRKTNLLFFGNFFKTSLEEYKWGMSTMMRDPNYLYGTLVDDIYYLGKVLGRKYKLVRIAYSVFMIGIIISAFAFILAISLNNSAPNTVIIEGGSTPF